MNITWKKGRVNKSHTHTHTVPFIHQSLPIYPFNYQPIHASIQHTHKPNHTITHHTNNNINHTYTHIITIIYNHEYNKIKTLTGCVDFGRRSHRRILDLSLLRQRRLWLPTKSLTSVSSCRFAAVRFYTGVRLLCCWYIMGGEAGLGGGEG